MALSSLYAGSERMPSRRRRAWFVVAGGVLLGVSFPPSPLAPLAWIALLPLLLLWQEDTSARTIYVDATCAFLITFAIAFQWPLFHRDLTTALLSFPGLVVIPLWMALPFGFSAALRRHTGPAAGYVLLAALFVLMEWGLRRGPFAFPWALLGHTQSEVLPVNRLVRFGGVPLLTAFLLSTNLLALTLLGPARRLRVPLAATVVLCLGLSFLPVRVDESAGAVRVGLVQPAVTAEAWADLDDPSRVHLLLGLSDTLAASGRVDLLVWPETALPPGPARAPDAVRRWVDLHRVPLLTGAIEEDPATGGYFNAALLVHPGGRSDVYRKRRLVPFAEHVPFQDQWPWVRRLAVPSGGVPGYARGRSGDLMQIQEASFGVLICFETLFDDLAGRYARRGAGLLVAITQDGWWGPTFGYRQHLAFNRLRAMETGLPLIQGSVSGISAVIRPDGAVGERFGWMERKAGLITVQPTRGNTPYVRWGDWVSVAAAVAAVVIVLMSLVRRSA